MNSSANRILLLVAASCLTVSCATAPRTGDEQEIEMPADLCDPGPGSEAASSSDGELPPILKSIEPSRAPEMGGVQVVIAGNLFRSGARVLIGGQECSDLAVQEAEIISCVVPASKGAVDVLVVNPGRKCALLKNAFEYTPKVEIDPKAKVVIVGASQRFTATSGQPPYKFSIYAGGGTIDESTGAYKAPDSPENAVIRVTDADGVTDESAVAVQPPLSIALTPQQDDPKSFEFTVKGGTPPVSYTVDSREEESDSVGNSIGTAIITVADGAGVTQSLKLKINRAIPMNLFPQARAIPPGGTTRLVAAGGSAGYVFSILSGGGSIDPKTGVFKAPSDPGSTTLRVTDSQGATMDTVVTIEPKEATPAQARLNLLAAGSAHTCWSDGTLVKCWGDNRSGQLGDGTLLKSLVPRVAKGLPAGIVDLVSGYSHVCALLRGGRVKCWGDNRYGQLGDGSILTSPTPVQVEGLVGGVQSIAAGQYHTCAVIRGGAVKCWGSNRRGQLGSNSLIPSNLPVKVVGLQKGAKQVSAGAAHTCALLEEGSVRCWGYNNTGQLGDGTLRDRLVPTQVRGIDSGAAQVALGGFHSCALLSEGSVKCWGNNGLGQLGDGAFQASQLPRETKALSGVKALAAGFYHTCAQLQSGEARCWGYNQDGQLGIGSETRRIPQPNSVKDLGTSALSIAAGANHSCASVPEGVRCWGSNSEGQFGNRTRESASVPSRAIAVQ